MSRASNRDGHLTPSILRQHQRSHIVWDTTKSKATKPSSKPTIIMTSYAITGASRGMGLEWIKQLSADSADNQVFALVRNPDTATGLVELATQRPNVHVITADVTSPTSMAAAARAVSEKSGGLLDVLIHNAVAYPADGEVMMATPSTFDPENEKIIAKLHDAFDIMWSTALYGTMWVTNSFLPLLEKAANEKGEAKVVNISSGMADTEFILKSGIDYSVPYSVGKAAMNALVAKYAVELKPKGIKVLAVSPGWVNTWPGESKSHSRHFAAMQDFFRKDVDVNTASPYRTRRDCRSRAADAVGVPTC